MPLLTTARPSCCFVKTSSSLLTMLTTIAVVTLLALPSAVGRAEDWPCWRGPTHDGLSPETGLPIYWTEEKGIRWKTPIPGRGHSSPIVVGDAVFVTSAIEDRESRILLRIDRTSGEVVWKREVLEAPLEPLHPLNSYSSSTPATDGRLVFVSFLDRDQAYVAAFDLDGTRVWEARPGAFSSKHGYCSSPVVYKDRLIINGDHDGESYLALLDKETGATVWKVPRAGKTRSYSVPRILSVGGRDQIILTGSFATSGFDPDSGSLLWTVAGPSEQMVASILDTDDLIFAMGGYPERHLLAIRKGGSGDVTTSHIAWRTHRGVPYVPSALLYGKLLHVVSDEGTYTCYEPETGKELSRKRIALHISGSLVGGDGKVYITSDSGETTVLENSSAAKVLASNAIGEDVFSSPAISQGDIFLRAAKHLFCIEGTNGQSTVLGAE